MISSAKWSGGKSNCWQKRTATVWLKILRNHREKKCQASAPSYTDTPQAGGPNTIDLPLLLILTNAERFSHLILRPLHRPGIADRPRLERPLLDMHDRDHWDAATIKTLSAHLEERGQAD